MSLMRTVTDDMNDCFYVTEFDKYIYASFQGLMNSINWLACHCMGLHSSDGRALQRERRGHGFESH